MAECRMASIQLVIFDCDGVLFHSEQANIRFFNAVLDAVGQPPLDDAQEQQALAMATSQLLEAILGHDEDLRRRAQTIARALDYGPFYEWMEPVDGLHDVLGDLRQAYHLAMATNRAKTTHVVVERFGLTPYLSLAVGTLDVERPKPHPDMLHKCLEHFSVEAAEAVFVGDTESDRRAAEAAEMHFVGIGGAVEAPRRVSAFRELPEVIAGLGRS